MERQITIENKCNQPRRRDLAKLREWHNDSRFGKGSLLGTIEDVWDSGILEGCPARPASDYIAAASTGDALSYVFGGWLLNLRSKLTAWGSRRMPDPGGPEAGPDEKLPRSEKISSLNADDALKVTNGVLTVVASTLPVVSSILYRRFKTGSSYPPFHGSHVARILNLGIPGPLNAASHLFGAFG